MPLQATSGAASYDGFGGGVAVVPTYIEDVFSTYLYDGNSSTQTITNGIDTSTYGGLVWLKDRSSGQSHALSDTVRGVGTSKQLRSNTTGAATTDTFTGFTTSGFTLDASFGAGAQNLSAVTYTSWSLRKQPKFFDVVTYTGTGSNTTIAHALGSVPGSIIVKRTNAVADWAVYHRSLANTQYLVLNTTAAAATGATWWNSTTPTSTVFSVGTDASVNASGGTYVAYLFAHDAGGFGLTGTDNVISCGSVTTDASGNATVNLGFEPQFVIHKQTQAASSWLVLDSARSMLSESSTGEAYLFPNLSNAEAISGPVGYPINSTGFKYVSRTANATFIYIAIRRGPMKVPTLGTSVYNAIARTGTGAAATITGVGFPPDLNIFKFRTESGSSGRISDRLRGAPTFLNPDATGSEGTAGNNYASFDMDGGTTQSASNGVNYASTQIHHFLRRAPGFFDEVCYTGTGVARTVTHNLTVAPELMIIKVRTPTGYAWRVYAAPLGVTQSLRLNTDNASETDTYWNGTAPTSTVFSVNNYGQVNNSGSPIVAYLFATCPGVSKVFSYTGNGSSQTINCGFTAGSRFVMIKRTDDTGDWYVWDSARGIVAGNDPHLSLNTTAAEVTTDDSVDTDNTGFIVNQVAATNVNVSSATYIGLAIA